MKGNKAVVCATAVTGLTAAFFIVSLFSAFSLGKIGFVWAFFLSPVLAVAAVSWWNELARRLRMKLVTGCVVGLALAFGSLKCAGFPLFYVDSVGPLYLVMGLAAVFMATLVVAAKF